MKKNGDKVRAVWQIPEDLYREVAVMAELDSRSITKEVTNILQTHVKNRRLELQAYKDEKARREKEKAMKADDTIPMGDIITSDGRQMTLYYDEACDGIIAEMRDTGFRFRLNDEQYESLSTASQAYRMLKNYGAVEIDIDELSDDQIRTPELADIERKAEQK